MDRGLAVNSNFPFKAGDFVKHSKDGSYFLVVKHYPGRSLFLVCVKTGSNQNPNLIYTMGECFDFHWFCYDSSDVLSKDDYGKPYLSLVDLGMECLEEN